MELSISALHLLGTICSNFSEEGSDNSPSNILGNPCLIYEVITKISLYHGQKFTSSMNALNVCNLPRRDIGPLPFKNLKILLIFANSRCSVNCIVINGQNFERDS